MADFAKNYSKISSLHRLAGKELLAKVSIEEGQSVLDVGCGTGELTALLAEKVGQHGRVLGIDPNEERIALAREKFKDVSNLSFVQAGICEIPRGDVYDIVFSNIVFHWIPDDELLTGVSMIREHLMKPGATMAVRVPQSIQNFQTVKSLLAKDTHWNLYMRGSDEYERLFKRGGFEDITCETIEISRSFKERETLRDYIYYGSEGLIDINDERLASADPNKNSPGEFTFQTSHGLFLARK